MLMGPRRKIRMQGNHGRMILCQMRGHRCFTFKPLQTLSRPVNIRHHSCDQSFIQSNHQRMPVLQNLAAIDRNSMPFDNSNSSFNAGIHGFKSFRLLANIPYFGATTKLNTNNKVITKTMQPLVEVVAW